MAVLWPLLVPLAFLCLQQAHCHYFLNDYEYIYRYGSSLNVFGKTNITTTVQFRVRNVNRPSSHDASKYFQLFLDDYGHTYDDTGTYFPNPANWDLNNKFYFNVRGDGVVDTVHHHEEDRGDVLLLKKALVSSFTTHRPDVAEVSRMEPDHFGTFQVLYKKQRVRNGYRIKRFHEFTHGLERKHSKDTSMKDSGEIDNIFMNDHVFYDDQIVVQSKSNDHEKQHTNVKYTGEFPNFQMRAKTWVSLINKKNINNNDDWDDKHLIKDSIIINKEYAQRREANPDNMMQMIHDSLTCVAAHADSKQICYSKQLRKHHILTLDRLKSCKMTLNTNYIDTMNVIKLPHIIIWLTQ